MLSYEARSNSHRNMKEVKSICKYGYLSGSGVIVLLASLLFAVSGCQEESEVITPPPVEQAILANSSLAHYIARVALNDGSSDNIVDNTSCTSLVFPFTVLVNGQEVTIISADDLTTVERILDESEDDNDTLSIVFPVTVMFADHTQQVIHNKEDFEHLAEGCPEGEEDEDIECVDFKYPLEISVYDSDNQVARVVVIKNDAELAAFFDTLEEGDYAGFKFPVTVFVNGGEEVTVTDNRQLEDLIKDHMDDCDEDDDNDHNDDDADDTDLINALLAGQWKVAQYFAGTDQSELFADFVITFHADGTTVSSDGHSSIAGEWETNGDDGTLVLDLELGETMPFDNMPDDWQVVEFDDVQVKLKNVDTDDESESTLVLQRI